MNQKLTLSVDQTAIARGKRFSRENGRSLSSVVEDFLLLLEPSGEIDQEVPVSGKLSSLVGIGSGSISEADYKSHLIERNEKLAR